MGLAIIPFSEILPSNMRLFNAATFIRAISPFFIFDISFSGTGIFIFTFSIFTKLKMGMPGVTFIPISTFFLEMMPSNGA